MRRVAVACLIACGGAVPISTPPPSTTEVAAPSVPRADFVVVPAELADPGVLDRIPHRVRIQAIGDSWLRDPGKVAKRGDTMKVNVVLPVLDETPDKVRVAIEDDKARLAIWIAKRDTWPILVAPTVLANSAGKIVRDVGVFAIQGAALHVASHAGPIRRVRVDDPDVELEGHVLAASIGTVWIAGAGDAPPMLSTGSDAEWKPPAPNPRVELAKGALVRLSPDPSAPVIAFTRSEGVAAKLLEKRGAYARVEIARRYARIVGFVIERELATAPTTVSTHGSGRGHGFGMSHAQQIDVPAGTCLYDELAGQVVGVTIESMIRLGSTSQPVPGWALVHVGTQWVTQRLYLKNLGDDPKQPKWESCTQPAVRK
jgi:hypothetical protein